MNEKSLKISGALAAFLSVCFMIFALLWVTIGWAPVLGNLISGAQLRSYAAQVYPGLAAEGRWAGYDMVRGCYSLAFTLEDGGGRRALSYDPRSKTVEDERRETVLRMDLGIAEQMQADGHMACWQARWTPQDPDTPLVGIRTDCYGRHGDPAPDEAAMREIMADHAMELYGELSPRTPVHTVSVYYTHEDFEDKDGGRQWYSIAVELPEDTALTREMVLSGKLDG